MLGSAMALVATAGQLRNEADNLMDRTLRQTMEELRREEEVAFQVELGAWRALRMLRDRPRELADLETQGLREIGLHITVAYLAIRNVNHLDRIRRLEDENTLLTASLVTEQRVNGT